MGKWGDVWGGDGGKEGEKKHRIKGGVKQSRVSEETNELGDQPRDTGRQCTGKNKDQSGWS